MLYRFENNKVTFARYKITATDRSDDGTELGKTTLIAVSDEEKDEIISRYPEAEVETIDTTEYQWIEALEFTQEQLKSGELDKAIEMGAEKYKTYAAESDVNYHVKVLEAAVLELAQMLSEGGSV